MKKKNEQKKNTKTIFINNAKKWNYQKEWFKNFQQVSLFSF